MTARRIAILVALAVCLAARPALACGACTDLALLVHLPFLPWWGGALLLWLAGTVILRIAFRRDLPEASPHVPDRGIVREWGILLFVGGPILAFVTMFSLLVPALLIGTPWAVQRLWRLYRARYVPAPTRPERVFRAFQGTLAAVLVLSVPATYLYRETTAWHIGQLDTNIGVTFDFVLPRLIGKGEDAVPALAETVDRTLKERPGAARTFLIRNATFCLGRIGGARAEAHLARWVRDRVDFKSSYDEAWQRMLCLDYADCAGARAIPLLKEVHARAEVNEFNRGRAGAIALLALARTAEPEALAFVLERMDRILETMEASAYDYAEAARVTAAALVTRAEPAALRNLPLRRDTVFEGMPVPPPSGGGERGEFYFPGWQEPALTAKEIAARWHDEAEAIRAYWTVGAWGE